MRKILIVGVVLSLGMGWLVKSTNAQRLPPESTANIPVGSCFDNGQCWNGKFWEAKAVKLPRTWLIEGTNIYITELNGVCIYDDYGSHAIAVISKRELPVGAGCQ